MFRMLAFWGKPRPRGLGSRTGAANAHDALIEGGPWLSHVYAKKHENGWGLRRLRALPSGLIVAQGQFD